MDTKDEKQYFKTLYSISNNIFNNYDIFKIRKNNNKFRTIYAPKINLKKIQRNILENILEKIEISEYAKAYCKGISLRENAISHINKKIVLKLDIEDFFENINFLTVYSKCFKPLFPKSVAYLLTTLCTYGDFVPQGAPTSAYISNIILKDFDIIIGNYCKNLNISYTRYSDDLTFSGDFNPLEIIKIVKQNLNKLRFNLNNKKTVIIKQSQRQLVTGIVVNKYGQVAKDYRHKIRQEVYYIKKYGLDSHLEYLKRNDKEKYIQELLCKIAYVLEINKDDYRMQEYYIYVKKLSK